MAHKIYLSASTQENNKGVGSYGTEEQRMFILRDIVEQLIKSSNHKNDFAIEKNNNKSSTLAAIVNESNNFDSELHLAFHTNAGVASARGCESYYSYLNTNGKGYKIASLWYNEVSKITPSSDRGVHKDNVLYSSGLYELSNTKAVAALMEFIFHSNLSDVTFFLANINKFAIATVKAIFAYFNYSYDINPYTGIFEYGYDNKWFTGTSYKTGQIVTWDKMLNVFKQYKDNYLDNIYQKK